MLALLRIPSVAQNENKEDMKVCRGSKAAIVGSRADTVEIYATEGHLSCMAKK